MSYYEKYLKYKTKYINYKTQLSNTKLNNTKLSNIEELGESDEELNDLSKLSLTGGSSKIRNLSKLTNNKSTKLQSINEISSLTETPTNNQSEKYIKTFKQTGGNSKSKAIQSINNLTETPTMKELYGYEYKDYSKLTNLLNNEQDGGVHPGKRARGPNFKVNEATGKLEEDHAENEDEEEKNYVHEAAIRAQANLGSNEAAIRAQANLGSNEAAIRAQVKFDEFDEYEAYYDDPRDVDKQSNVGNNAANTNAITEAKALADYEAHIKATEAKALADYEAYIKATEANDIDYAGTPNAQRVVVGYSNEAAEDDYEDREREQFYQDPNDYELSNLIDNMDITTGGGKKSKRNSYFFKNADLSDTSENNLYLIDS